MSMTFATNLVPSTNGDKTLGSSDYKWDLYVDAINGVTYPGAPIIATTTNATASDSLTAGAQTLNEGQLVFLFLNKAMNGTTNATLTFGSGSALNIYITSSTRLNAAYSEGSLLGLLYSGGNLYMINPPIVV